MPLSSGLKRIPDISTINRKTMEISIIIPVYNKTSYIEKCLQSIFSQDFPSFEVIAVDDGSTDASGKICDKWAADEPRLRVFHTPNSGVTAARRYGVKHADGKYIMFVDADDLLTDGALTNMHRTITQSGADEVIGPYIDQYGVIHDSGFREWTTCEPLIRDLLATRNSFCVLWGIIFKKNC